MRQTYSLVARTVVGTAGVKPVAVEDSRCYEAAWEGPATMKMNIKISSLSPVVLYEVRVLLPLRGKFIFYSSWSPGREPVSILADFLALQLVLTARSGAPLRLMGYFAWPI